MLHRHRIVCALLLATLTLPLHAQQAEQEAARAASHYLDIVRTEDWSQVAAMYPTSVATEVAGRIAPHLGKGAGAFVATFLPGETSGTVGDEALLVALLTAASEMNPLLGDEIAGEKTSIIGTSIVHDTAYVAYRLSTRRNDRPITSVTVLALVMERGSWRPLLPNDVELLLSVVETGAGADAPQGREE